MKKSFILLLLSFFLFGFVGCDKPEIPEDEKTEQTPEENEGDQNGDENGDENGDQNGDQNGDENGDENGDQNGGENGDQGGSSVTMPEGYEDAANSRVPINWSPLYAEGSDVGVTIEVKQLAPQNFVFELRPGPMVQSFRLDVYPLAHLYNYLLNDQMFDKEAWEIEEQIRSYMYNEEGSGAYTFSINDYENPEDFLQIEFDWMNTAFSKTSAIVIPDCDYIIAVVGCTDKGGYAQEDITLCYVHTPWEPLIGDPGCEIEVNVGYRKFSVNHILNADAAGIYYYGGLADEIDQYLDLYGDTMLRDFVRTRLSAPVTPDNVDALYYTFDYGQYADHTIQSATIAVCCDANLTPQQGYSRRDFHLEEIPEDQEIGDVSVKVVEERVAAAYMEFDAEFSKSCNTIFYRYYSLAQKLLLESSSDVERMREAIDLVNVGYGCHNPGFVWDSEAKEPIGTGATVRLAEWGIPFPAGETFYIGYTGRNGFGTPTGLQFSEPITLDERNLTSPDACQVKDLKLTLSRAGRNVFYYDITYDPQTVSRVYCQYFTATNNPGLDENSTWVDWMNYIFTPDLSGTGEYSNININAWRPLASGRDYGAFTGMIPGEEYTVFVVAEDFDGNVSEVVFDKITTAAVQVGPDPTVALDLHPYETGVWDHDWEVSFTIQKDVEYMRYTHINNASDLVNNIPGISTAALNDIKNSGISYEDWVNGIYAYVLGDNGDGGGLVAESDAHTSWAGDGVVIAACVAVGKNEDGTPAYNLFHLVCENGKATTLEEIFGIN